MTKYAWLAGIIDTDGSLLAMLMNKKGWVEKQLRLRTVVYNTDLPTIEHCKAVADCGYFVHCKRKLPRQTMHRWVLEGKMLVPVLRKIIPHLVVKWRQAEILGELKNLSVHLGDKRDRSRITQLVSQVQFLNANHDLSVNPYANANVRQKMAWLAGVIDGDGSVYASMPSKSRLGVRPVVTISSTDVSMIRLIVSEFGAKYRVDSRGYESRAVFQGHAIRKLGGVSKYMVTKRERLNLAFKLLESYGEDKRIIARQISAINRAAAETERRNCC